MKLFIIFCLLTTVLSQRVKIPKKIPNEDFFKADEDLQLPDDDEDETPNTYAGNVMQAKILGQQNSNFAGQGKIKYTSKTENGIEISQVGKLKDSKTFVVMGSYSYTGADGKRYRVKYTADEFGYHPITELDLEIPELELAQIEQKPLKPFAPYKFDDFNTKFTTRAPITTTTTTTQRTVFQSLPPLPKQQVQQIRPQLPEREQPSQDLYLPPIVTKPLESLSYLPPKDYLPPNAYLPPKGYLPPADDFTVV